MVIEDALRCALDGDAILFVGAGVSFLASNHSGECLPDAASLIDILLEQPRGTGSKHTLDRVSGHALKKKGVDWVYDTLRRSLSVEKVDSKLIQLYNVPWRRIYTTNYDNAIEVARKGTSKVSTLTLDEEVSTASPSSIIHLNGYIGRVSSANLQDGLILSDRSYVTSRLTESEWYKFFLRDIRAARAIIFVGYSLSDLDIQRALISEESLRRKSFFFVSPNVDELESDSIKDFGELVDGGIDALSKAFVEASTDYDPVRASVGFTALTEIVSTNESAPHASAAQRVIDQLVYGKLPEQQVLNGEFVFDKHPYLVVRKQDRAAMEAMRKGPWRDFLFVGELASGKTASALNMSAYFLTEGYRVYYAVKSASLLDELDTLAVRNQKSVVVFENYYTMAEEIRAFCSKRKPHHRIVMTERAVTHELMSDFLDRTPRLGPTFEIGLDRIELEDVGHFEALVNFAGLWGERAGGTEQSRRNVITGHLESSLYKLLVEIIQSERVQSEVRRLMEPLSFNRKALKLFVASFIVNVLGFRFTLNDWQAVFDGQWVRRTMRTYQEQVRHFLTLSGDTIFPRVGVLSAQILKTFAEDDVVRECLVELYERSVRDDDRDPEFVSLRIALTRYRSLEPIFSGPKKAANIFRYYDDIRVYGNTRNNPDYWLQVGIAATIYDDLERAEIAFENAYAREKAKRNPNLKKIDNYYSRYQMRLAVEEHDPDAAFGIFLKANERLKKQIFLDENRHYPFKTGRYYADVAAKHYPHWSDSQQRQFIVEAGDIRERAYEWRDSKREFSADVAILIRETTSLLERLVKDKATEG